MKLSPGAERVFVVIDLMQGVLRQFLQSPVRIHDAGFLDNPKGIEPPAPENLMFDSDRLLIAPSSQPASVESSVAGPTHTLGLDVGERRWNIYFRARQEFAAPAERWLPWIAFFAGITISLLLFGLTRSLATTSSRAIKLADHITDDLRKSEASLAEAQRMTAIDRSPAEPDLLQGDTDGRYLGVNKAWEKFFGISRASLHRQRQCTTFIPIT